MAHPPIPVTSNLETMIQDWRGNVESLFHPFDRTWSVNGYNIVISLHAAEVLAKISCRKCSFNCHCVGFDLLLMHHTSLNHKHKSPPWNFVSQHHGEPSFFWQLWQRLSVIFPLHPTSHSVHFYFDDISLHLFPNGCKFFKATVIAVSVVWTLWHWQHSMPQWQTSSCGWEWLRCCQSPEHCDKKWE